MVLLKGSGSRITLVTEPYDVALHRVLSYIAKEKRRRLLSGAWSRPDLQASVLAGLMNGPRPADVLERTVRNLGGNLAPPSYPSCGKPQFGTLLEPRAKQSNNLGPC